MKDFLKRHPRVSVKSLEQLSAARAVGMNKTVIFKWFDIVTRNWRIRWRSRSHLRMFGISMKAAFRTTSFLRRLLVRKGSHY